jgi:hypothetical protein
MESGMIGTNGKLVWENKAGRLRMHGETVGKKFITGIQSFQAGRCQNCPLIFFDHSHAK